MGTENITPAKLAEFHGSAVFYRHRLAPNVVASEGAQFLSENGAGWLIDVIASHQFNPEVAKCDNQRWTLTVDPEKKTAKVVCSDDYCEDYHELVTQDIHYTDFPLPKIELLCSNNGQGMTIFLRSEN